MNSSVRRVPPLKPTRKDGALTWFDRSHHPEHFEGPGELKLTPICEFRLASKPLVLVEKKFISGGLVPGLEGFHLLNHRVDRRITLDRISEGWATVE